MGTLSTAASIAQLTANQYQLQAQEQQEKKSLLGKIAGGVLGGVAGFCVGGPIGAVVGAGAGVAAAKGAEKVFSSEKGGHVGGAVVGGLVGSAFGPIGTIAGGAIGTVIGGKIGEKNEQQNTIAQYGYMPSMMYPSMMGGLGGMTSSGLGIGGFGMGNSALTGVGTDGLYNYSNNGYDFSTSLKSDAKNLTGVSTQDYIKNMNSAENQAQIMEMAQKMMSSYLGTYGSALGGVANLCGGTEGLMQNFNNQSSQYLKGISSFMGSVNAK